MTIEVESIIGRMQSIMDTELSDTLYNSLVSVNQPLSDSITTQMGIGANAEPFFGLRPERTPMEYILNRLGHLSANPSDAERVELLKQVYVYVRPDDRSRIDTEYPNWNLPSASQFIKDLVLMSHEERDLYLRKTGGPRQVVVIHGPRGVGKTFFTNHVFTLFNEDLTRNDVIWIRINIPDNFGGDDPDIIHWLRSKVCLVVFRYYQDNPKLKGLVSDTEKYIQTQPEHLRIKLSENLANIDAMFSKWEGPEKLTEETVDQLIARHLVDQIIKRDFSFIYIIDGLDRLDITPRQEYKIRNVHKRLATLVDRDTLLGGCYVLVTRTESLIRMISELDLSFSKQAPPTKIPKQILPASFDSIVETRLDFLANKLPKILQAKILQDRWPERYRETDWAAHMMDFKNHLINLAEEQDLSMFYTRLNDLYGVNQRAKIHLLQLCYHNYLKYTGHSQRYKLVETMCKGGFKYPPRIIQYQYDNDKKDLVPELSNKIFDNVFLPTLFDFPTALGMRWKKVPYAQTYILAKVRSIQMLRAIAMAQRSSSNKVPTIAAIKLINILKFFGYEESMIHKIVEELSEYGIIATQGSALQTPSRYENLQLECTPKLNAILGGSLSGSKGLLVDIAYLNICAMRLPLNRDLLIDPHRKVPFIKAHTLDKDKIEPTEIRKWTIWKIINTISLVRIIRKANKHEHNKIRGKTRKPKELSENFDLIFSLPSEMKINVTRQAQNIIKEMELRKDFLSLNELVKALNQYEQVWRS